VWQRGPFGDNLGRMPRRLGQHFLHPGGVGRLISAIAPRPDQTFLEIGPGNGALSLPLAERAGRVVAVEIDEALVERLRSRPHPRLEIVHADALESDLAQLVPPGSRLVGNLPYYISSPLLRRALALRDRFLDAHVMVQEEVARRVASPPGSKDYGILSVLFAAWAEVDVPLHFSPGDFTPPPRVRSALLRARFRPHPDARVADQASFERLVLRAFGRRRRTLENNLRDSYANLKENLRLLKIEGGRRAETLSVVEFARLAEALREI
jgi:16S rRNA (adenine1518-N6/adenine1519-N6)-dimethyltransferase